MILRKTNIKSNRSLLDLQLGEIYTYKDLLFLLIRRDLVTSYKQTILGPLWVIIQALAGSAVFTIIFGKIANLSTDGHPAFLFYLCGNLAWQYFGSVFGIGSNALQSNLGLFSKVYFPRLLPPISQCIATLANFVIQLLVLLVAIYVYRLQIPSITTSPSMGALLLPVLVLQSALLALGIGFIISAASVKYRDISRMAGLSTQFIMYASPIIYPISEIPEKYQAYLAYNPLTFIVESYRFILLGHSTGCSLEFAIPSIIITLAIFFLGCVSYNLTQRTYVDFA